MRLVRLGLAFAVLALALGAAIALERGLEAASVVVVVASASILVPFVLALAAAPAHAGSPTGMLQRVLVAGCAASTALLAGGALVRFAVPALESEAPGVTLLAGVVLSIIGAGALAMHRRAPGGREKTGGPQP